MLLLLHNFLNVVALKPVTFMLVGDELNIWDDIWRRKGLCPSLAVDRIVVIWKAALYSSSFEIWI